MIFFSAAFFFLWITNNLIIVFEPLCCLFQLLFQHHSSVYGLLEKYQQLSFTPLLSVHITVLVLLFIERFSMSVSLFWLNSCAHATLLFAVLLLGKTFFTALIIVMAKLLFVCYYAHRCSSVKKNFFHISSIMDLKSCLNFCC